MGLARFALIFTGLSFLGYGLFCWFVPDTIGRFTGLGMESTAARTEVIAMYGGLQSSAGVFFLLAGLRRDWVFPGICALVLIMGGLAVARGFAMGILGPTGYNEGAVAYEALTAIVGIIAMLRLPRVQSPASSL